MYLKNTAPAAGCFFIVGTLLFWEATDALPQPPQCPPTPHSYPQHCGQKGSNFTRCISRARPRAVNRTTSAGKWPSSQCRIPGPWAVNQAMSTTKRPAEQPCNTCAGREPDHAYNQTARGTISQHLRPITKRLAWQPLLELTGKSEASPELGRTPDHVCGQSARRTILQHLPGTKT